MASLIPPVRLFLAGNIPEELVRGTMDEINQTSLFNANIGETINPIGLRESSVLRLDEAIDFLMTLRRKEHISLVLTTMPVLDRYDRRTFGLAVEGDSGFLGASMVSTSRLLGPGHSSKDINPKAKDRLAKESLHELGHAMGLRHCRIVFCAMRRSLEPLEVDARQLKFCPKCLLNLELKCRLFPR